MNRRAALLATAFIITALGPAFPQQPAPQDRIAFRIIVVETAEAAGQVLQRLNGGENFLALAQRISVDPSASTGGLVGPVTLSDLRPELRSALERLTAGQLSDVVPLPTGFAILKIVPAVEAAATAPVAPSRLADAPMGSFTSALSATGSVKYVFDVSGYIDTTVSLRQYSPSEQDQQNLLTLCQVRRKLVTTAQALVQKVLSSPSVADLAPIDREQTYFLEGQLHAFRGDMGPAVAAFEKA
ncbi:MAG TPA: peptidylprolyl isomerase, partial [Vicinamibacterales bacterium]|nr:peptidylprolyl isomerase [Vicinamibacterales bacterium]